MENNSNRFNYTIQENPVTLQLMEIRVLFSNESKQDYKITHNKGGGEIIRGNIIKLIK